MLRNLHVVRRPNDSQAILFADTSAEERAQLPERLVGLEAPERALLDLMSIAGVPLVRSQLARALTSLGLRDECGDTFKHDIIVDHLDTLIDSDLVDEIDQRFLACPEAVVSLPWKIKKRPEFAKLVRAVREAVLSWKASFGETATFRELAELRCAFLSGDIASLNAATYREEVPVGRALITLTADMPPEYVRGLPPLWTEWCVRLLTLTGGQDAARFVEQVDEITPRANALGKDSAQTRLRARLDAHFAERALLAGDWADVNRRLRRGESSCLDGPLWTTPLWLSGRQTTSEFVEAVREMDRALHGRKRAVPLLGLGHAFYFTALLSLDERPADDEVFKATKKALRSKDGVWCPSFAYSAHCMSARRLGKSPDVPFPALWAHHATERLLLGVLAAWEPERNEDARAYQTAELLELINEQHHAGWCVRQALAALQRVDAKAAREGREKVTPEKLHASEGEVALAELVRHKQPWEHFLELLEANVPTPAGTKSEEPEQQSARLVWLLSCRGDRWHLEPRLKTKNSKGKTPGRKVALKRLYEHKDLPCELSEQDTRVVGHISKRVQSTYYRYPDISYDFDPRALLELVGHSAVFDYDAPERRLEVELGEPRVRLVELEGGYRLVPHPRGSSGVTLVREGNIVTVYSLSPEQLALFQRLEPGLVIPKQGLKRVQGVLQGLSHLVPCEGLQLESANARQVDPDSKPIVQLAPIPEGLRATVIVRPLGAGTAGHAPGEGAPAVMARVGEQLLATRRDLEQERKRLFEVLKQCPLFAENGNSMGLNRFEVEGVQNALEVLSCLSEAGVTMEWPEGQPYRLLRRRLGAKSLRVSVKTAREWFEIDGELQVDEEQKLDLATLLARLRPGERFVELDDGCYVELERSLLRQLASVNAYRSTDTKKVELHPLGAIALLEAEDWNLSGDAAFEERRKELEAALRKPVKMPRTLQAELRDY